MNQVLINTLRNLISDAELILKKVEQGECPSQNLKGTFTVNAEGVVKKLREVWKSPTRGGKI